MDGSPESFAETATTALLKDPLTGLYQQDFLFNELNLLLQKQRAEPVEATLALLQLENFYEIRRWVGKSEANLLLSDIARLLSRSLPRSVLLCRCAHYEFAALLIDDSSLHAQLLIQRVKQAMLSAVSDSIPPQLELKCGVGLAPLAPAIPSAEVLFARARHNLSLVLSRQRVSAHADTAQDGGPEISRAQLLQVLQSTQLALSYQALLGFRPDQLCPYEVRCSAVDKEFMLPATALFESANQNALGEQVDRWVIGKSIKQLSQPDSLALRLTVNLTLNTIVSTRFFPWLREQVAEDASLPPRLVFQISELDLLTAQHHMQFFCEQLGELQIKLSINHFGCTPDPFRYLSLLHAHYVKLDSSWLENIHTDPGKQDQLQALTARLGGSGLRIIVGMIEEMALLPLLWAANINLVQGFALHEPAASLNCAFLWQHSLDLSRHTGALSTN